MKITISLSAGSTKLVPTDTSAGIIAAALVKLYGGSKQPNAATSSGSQAILPIDLKSFQESLTSQGWEKADWVMKTANVWFKDRVSLTIEKGKGALLVDVALLK
jgi:hypothetical protein